MGGEPEIIFEDGDLLVVDKPCGMIVHPAPGHEQGSLTGWAVRHCPGIAKVGSVSRPGVVHRLDIETSGVMVLAKTVLAYTKLREAFEAHSGIVKKYLAVVHGAIKPAKGKLETQIGRKPWDPRRMAVVESGGEIARTAWETVGRSGGVSLVEFVIATGRTHQIRVHAAHLGHPIAGDSLYGDRKKDANLRPRPTRLMLHAVQLGFSHPRSGERLVFAAPPPRELIYIR